MESETYLDDEVAEQNLNYRLPKKIRICNCGGIPGLIRWNYGYIGIYECPLCKGRKKGDLSVS